MTLGNGTHSISHTLQLSGTHGKQWFKEGRSCPTSAEILCVLLLKRPINLQRLAPCYMTWYITQSAQRNLSVSSFLGQSGFERQLPNLPAGQGVDFMVRTGTATQTRTLDFSKSGLILILQEQCKPSILSNANEK